MNKNILKYVLRGIIAFGTVNFLNGVSLKIIEKKQGESCAQKTVRSISATNTPVIDLTGLKNPLTCPIPSLSPISEPDEIVPEQPDQQVQKNMLVIAKSSSPTPADTLSEKHKKNYLLPRIYRKVGPGKPENQKVGITENTAEQEATDNYDCFSASGDNSPRYNNSHASSHSSNSAEDRMLNELIQGMIAQENSSKSHGNGRDTYSAPQNYSESTDTAPQNSTSPKSGTQKDTTKKDSPKQATNTQTTGTETIPTGIIEPGQDSENGELMQKTMKKLNKKNKKKQEQDKKGPAETKKPEAEKTHVQAPVIPNTPEQKIAENPAEIPTELVECYTKFVETINSAAQDAKTIDNFFSQSINWITAARKNSADTKVQKSLASYKCFIEQQITGCDQVIANIRAAKEGTEAEKNVVCQNITQLRSLYESILKAFDAPEQTAQPSQESKPEKGLLDRTCDKIEGWCNSAAEFIDNHKTASTVGVLGGIGAWLGAKYFAQQKKTAKPQ